MNEEKLRDSLFYFIEDQYKNKKKILELEYKLEMLSLNYFTNKSEYEDETKNLLKKIEHLEHQLQSKTNTINKLFSENIKLETTLKNQSKYKI